MLMDVVMVSEQVGENELDGKTVIVLDVFRATTVMVTAFKNGCSEIYPIFTVEQAWEKAHELKQGEFVLGGERENVKISRFDFGNSPLEYTNDKVCGKKLIITTTNGTKAIEKSKFAEKLFIGSFLNAKAAAEKALHSANDIVIMCSGTNGALTLEDVACAGLIADSLSENGAALTDAAICAREVYYSNSRNLDGLLSKTKHYNALKQHGFNDDIAYSLQMDITDIVPVYKDGKITL